MAVKYTARAMAGIKTLAKEAGIDLGPVARRATGEPTLPDGTVILAGTIAGHAAPWTATTFSKKHARKRAKSQRHKDWKATVAANAKVMMGDRPPYAGPVVITRMVFRVCTRTTPADLTNLQKSFEDGLNGSVYVDDTQVWGIDGLRRFPVSDPSLEGVEFEVVAMVPKEDELQ